MPKITLIRGLPGSGKSTMAKAMGCLHLEADMYFAISGKYIFDASLLKEAHAFCQKMAENAMGAGVELVVSNTFTQKWEMEPYLGLAEEYGYEVVVITATGEYTNVHGVPPQAIQRMKERWED